MVIKNQRLFLVVGINLSVFLVVLMFQACGKDYGVSLQSAGLPPKCRTGNCITSQINPEIDTVRPPTKILFVVDNSRTMKLSQGYLANGASSLAKDLRGFDADFYIYSTSDSHQKKSDIDGNLVDKDDKPVLAVTPIKSCKWTEKVDGKNIEKIGGDCPNTDKTEYVTEWLNLMNSSLSPNLNFRSNYTEGELNLASDNLSKAITGVGVDGSSTETGLCSLVRAVYNDSANSIFKKGDNAAMVVMSDEDDASLASKCLSRTTQKEAFVGKSAEKQACDQSKEKCDEVDYKVDFGAMTATVPYAELKADYKCETLTNGACEVNGNCTKVTYSYNNLGVKVQYSCLNKVDYTVKFNDVISYSRALNYSCFSKVPYTISFNNIPSFSQTMTYQCEQLEDGVPVATSTPKVFALNNSVAACVDGAEVACDSQTQNLASSKCATGTRLLVNSCKLKCVVGSQAVGSVVYNDTSSAAKDRDLANTAFSVGSVNYANLSDWASQNYPQYTMKANGIARGVADVTTPTPLTLTGLTSACTNGELVDCDSTQRQQASNSCGSSSKNIVSGSCKVKCVKTSTPSSVIYSDLRSDSDNYNLAVDSFTDPAGGQSYANLSFWGNAKYSPKTVNSVTRAENKTNLTEKFIGENCSVSDSVGVDCAAADLTWTASAMACNGKKVKTCKRKCVGEAKILVLESPSEDKVNFCTNTDSAFKFAKTADGAPEFTNIQDYATATINVGQTATITNCTRSGDGYSAMAQTALVKTYDNKGCAEMDTTSVFATDLATKCKLLNPKQNGITSGSVAYNCADKTKVITVKDAINNIPDYTHMPVNNENICTSSVKIGATTYSSLKQYFMTLNGREDLPNCSPVRARKTIVPAGVVSNSKVTESWTFPKTVPAESPEANLEKAFVSRSTELFGENGFFVSAIVRDQIEDAKESSCAPLGADQSLGTKYRSLVDAASARSTGAKGDVTSICATDYSKALTSVSDWIKHNAKRTVFMPDVKEGNEILSVWLVRENTGEEMHLVEGSDYEVVGNKVNLINPAIDPKGWLIKYVYWVAKDPASAE